MRSLLLELTPARVLVTKAAGCLWRGAYFGPLAPLRYLELPRPRLPGARWVRVRTLLGGICGSDVHQVWLDGSLSVAPAALPGASPAFLGHEAVGVVLEVGPEVRTLRPGDRVVMDGTDDCFAAEREPRCRACAAGNRIVCERTGETRFGAIGGGWSEEFVRHESNLFPVPEDLTDEEAVLIEPASNGVRAALRARPAPGEKVLVIGAGTIGLMTIQALLAAEPECDVSASVLFRRQAEEALARGARRALVREDLLEAAARLTGARVYRGFGSNRTTSGGFDLICDCVGSARTLGAALRCTRTGGRVLLAGAALRPMKLDLTPVWHQEVDLLGMRSHGVEQWHLRRMASFERVLEWRREGRMKLSGLLTDRFRLAEYRRALSLAAARNKQRHWSLKVAFDFR